MVQLTLPEPGAIGLGLRGLLGAATAAGDKIMGLGFARSRI